MAPKGTRPRASDIKAAADRAEGVRSVGRPTKYHIGYCDEVIEAGTSGLSLTAFAGDIGVSRATINNWMAEHPEFLEATKIHAAKRALYLERGMLAAENGPQVTARIFALKNAAPEEWREKVVQEHTGRDGAPIQIETADFASSLTHEERAQLRQMLVRFVAGPAGDVEGS